MSTTSPLTCLCQTINEPLSLLSSEHPLPHPSEICHCNTCHRSSGALCPAFLKLRSSPSSTSIAACSCYDSTRKIRRYFCRKCGSRTFDFNASSGDRFVCSGLAEERDVVNVTSHDYVGDTGDGGLAVLLRKLGGRSVPRYAEGRNNSVMTDSEMLRLQVKGLAARESELLASCHCGSIQFYILPPEAAGESLRDPTVRRWVRENDTKYLALNCACRDCRRALGFSFASYIYVMPENIVTFENENLSPFSYTSRDQSVPNFEESFCLLKARSPGLKSYGSSRGVRRSFCGTCGASVFFERASRPQCVNVAVGILRAESGSLARDWIEFDWEVCWREQAVDQELVDTLQALR